MTSLASSIIDRRGFIQSLLAAAAASAVITPERALAGATPYLRMLGTVLGDWVLQRSAAAAPGTRLDVAMAPALIMARAASAVRWYQRP